MAWIRIWLSQTSSFLSWDERDRVRGRRSGGYERGVVIRRRPERVIKWGGHRSDRGDWDRPKEEVMGDGDQGGGQKEEVRRGRGKTEQITDDDGQGGGVQRKWWSKEAVRGRSGGKTHTR